VIVLAVAFVMVKLRVVGNCAWPPVVLKQNWKEPNCPCPLHAEADTPLKEKVFSALVFVRPPLNPNVGP
jgi:hypothetical protein